MSSARSPNGRTLLVRTGVLLAALLAWDASLLDLVLARAVGGPAGFDLRDNWVLAHLLHDGARRAAWVLVLGLCMGVWWPVGPLRRLDVHERVQLALTTLLAAFAVSVLKSFSTTSCPWDLSYFGGIARYTSHWSGVADGGAGRCFPAGHASSGFAFIGGYFAFRRTSPGQSRAWLCTSIAAGLVLGIVQQLRGAHFASHTLWTGFICWTTALAVDAAFTLHKRQT